MQHPKGFTLVEISIVLVVIGLLAGGILKAQNMIETMKYNKFKDQVTSFQAAVYAFQAQYRYYPGDYPRASTKFTAPAGITIFDGDGNGLLTSTISWVGPSEQAASIQHLKLAGLLQGEVTNTDGYNATLTSSEGSLIAGLGSSLGGHVICILNMRESLIKRLDEELDDGILTTGKVYAWSHSGWGGNPQLYNGLIKL